MKKPNVFLYVLFFLISSVLLLHCDGVQSAREDRRVRELARLANLDDLDDDELDEVITDVEASIKDKFKNIFNKLEKCESSTPSTPQTRADLGFSLLGIQRYNRPQQLRVCFQQRLESATELLCTAKQEIYSEKQRCRNFDFRCTRLDTSINRLENLQRRYKTTLRKTANEFSGCSSRRTGILRADECSAWHDIIDHESFITCDYDDRSRRY